VTRILAVALAFALSGGPAVPSAPPARPSADLESLARLYKEGRYFELRDAVASLPGDASGDVEFFRAAVDQVFNRLETAVPRLQGFLAVAEKGRARPLAKEAWVLLSDAYRRLGRYGDAAGALRSALDRFGPVLDRDERAKLESEAGLWSSLSGVPPQSVEVPEDVTVRMTNRHLPVSVGQRTFFVGYDTGTTVSVLYASMAAELGVPRRGPAMKARTSTGGWVEGHVGVLPEMRLGPVVIRHAVVLILPDEVFPSSPAGADVGLKGLIGAPILEAFGEFTETAAGEFLVPARPARRPAENMCLSGFMPVVEAFHRGARIDMCLDTGASATVLYLPFYRRYRGEINARSRERVTRLGGVGGSRMIRVRILDVFDFQAGGKSLALRKVMIQAHETHPDSRNFHGVLGIDLLSQCSRMTLNFVSMSFILE
jgi:hypothetical protein